MAASVYASVDKGTAVWYIVYIWLNTRVDCRFGGAVWLRSAKVSAQAREGALCAF